MTFVDFCFGSNFDWAANSAARPTSASPRHLQTHAVQQNPTSFDNLVGAGKQHRWHCKSERFGGLQVNDQLELGRLLHWKIGRLGAFEYLIDVAGGTPVQVSDMCPVRQESPATANSLTP